MNIVEGNAFHVARSLPGTRARVRGIYPAETVAITSFPWELFGNRWGKFPRTDPACHPSFVVLHPFLTDRPPPHPAGVFLLAPNNGTI